MLASNLEGDSSKIMNSFQHTSDLEFYGKLVNFFIFFQKIYFNGLLIKFKIYIHNI